MGSLPLMPGGWSSTPYADWRATCDTLHAHTQLLGKLAVALAPPEPELQHGALRLTTRGWATHPLPAPDHLGALEVTMDLHAHVTEVAHSDGRTVAVPLTPDRPVAAVTADVLEAVTAMVGEVTVNLRPQEVSWSAPLDEDAEHATYDVDQVRRYHEAAMRAALVLAEVRAPYRGRSTPVNAWWGTFDLAVSLYSGRPADPGPVGLIRRNSGDAQQIEIGWWPGDDRHGQPAFYAFAAPAPDGFADADVPPAAARWDAALGEYLLDDASLVTDAEPHATAVAFGRAVVRHACLVCGWEPSLAASAEGLVPPVR
jgi:hypothetical protein